MRAFALVAVVAVATASCATSNQTPTASDESSPTASTTTSEPPPKAPTVPSTLEVEESQEPAAWSNGRVPVLLPGGDSVGPNEVGAPEVIAIEATSVGYVAVGEFGGGLTIWASADFEEFSPIYHEACCDRFARPSAVAEFDNTLIVGGSAQQRSTDDSVAFLVGSTDGGATWSDLALPAELVGVEGLDRLEVVGDSLVAEFVDEGPDFVVTSVLMRTEDLVNWEEISLPGREAEDWPFFVTDGVDVFALASRDDPESGTFSMQVWASADGGRSFELRPPMPSGWGDPVVVDGALVVLPQQRNFEPGKTTPTGLQVLAPGSDWVERDLDVGQFGDGYSSMQSPVTAPDGRTYALLARESRANAHYCYEDVSTCRQLEAALVSTVSPEGWLDVADVNLNIESRWSGIVADADGAVHVWGASFNEATLDVLSWTAAAPPSLIDPPGYPNPTTPVELLGPGQPLEVGDEARYVLPTGGCGGMYINNTRWEPVDPLPEPVPDDWPYQAQRPGTADGASGYLYSRITRTADDSIDLAIEGIGVVATFNPAPPLEEQCG